MRKTVRHSILAAFVSLLAACGGADNIGTAPTNTTPGTTTCPAGQTLNSTGVCETTGTTPITPTTGTGVPQTITLASAQNSIIADGVSTAVLTATLLDTVGQPIAGKSIGFTPNAGTVSAPTATTDSSGKATVTLKSSTTAGRSTITARETGSGLSATTSVSFVAGAAANLAISANPASVAPSQTSTIGLLVTDTSGNPVAGEPVQLTVSQNQSNGSLSASTFTTDENGQATANYVAGSANGTDILQAKTSFGTKTVNLVVSTAAKTIGGVTLTLGSATPTAGSAISAVAKVVDSSGQALPGISVSFSASAGGLSPASATTGSDGSATVTYTAPTKAGAVTVTAVSGGFSSSARATVVAGNVSNISIQAAPTAVAPNRTSSVTAFLSDANGNAIAGRSINFSATAGSGATSGSFSSPTATTDASGTATVGFTPAACSATGATCNFTITGTANPEGISGNAALTVNPNAVSVQDMQLTSTSTSIPADNTTTTLLRAKVTGSDGNAMQGVSVSFAASTGTLSSSAALTDSSGTAQVTLKAANAGTATVTASIGGISRQVNVTVTASATGVPQSLTVAASQAGITADGTSSTLLTATLLDTAGQPISGKAISFTPNAGTVSASTATTDSSGKATVTLRSSSTAGRSTITAREGGSGLSASTSVSFVAGAATNLALSAAPSTVAPAGQATLSAVVTDANGNRVTGEPVNLSFTGNASGASLSSFLLTTDSNGQASSSYTAGSNAGTDTIQGKLSSGVTQTASVAVSAVVRPVNGVTLLLGNASPTAGSQSSVTAKVVDSAGNGLRDVDVNFDSTAGTIPPTGKTGSDGTLTVTFTAPTTTGRVTLKAAAAGIFASQTADVVAGKVNTVVLSLAPNKVAPGRSSSVSAQVTDSSGNAVPNHSVQFAATPANGTFSSTTATTDGSGIATVSFTPANDATGSTGLQATANPENIKSAVATLTIDPNAVALQSISLVALSGSMNADGTSQAKVRATASGSDGSPVSNIGISFSTTLGTPATQTINTDAKGVADFLITAPLTAGTATVTAVSSGVSRQTTVRFNAGPIKNLSLQLSNATVAAGSSVSVIASATDANGNVVAGESLTFSVPANGSGGSYTSATTLTTGNDGTASATYSTGVGSAGGVSDTLKVVANSNSAVTQQQAVVINSNVGSLSLTAAAASITANGTDATSVTALLQDANGNPLRNASVNFRTSKGSLSPAAAIVQTDNVGRATIRLISDTSSGNAVVTGVVGGAGSNLLSASVPVQFLAGDPASVIVVASPDSMATGGRSSISVRVLDANGNGVPSQNVKVAVKVNNSGGSPSNFALVTDATGRATVVYTAGSTTGVADTLSFVTDNGKETDQVLTVNAAQATITNISLALGTDRVQAGSSGTVAVRATVTGSSGPVSGATVSFLTSAGGLNGPTAQTDSAGIATVQLTPPTKASTVILEVNASGFIDRQTLTVTPGAAAAAQSTISSSPSVILADGNATSTITVTLNDQFSNSLPDGTAVSVTSSAGTFPNGSSGVLSNGQASFVLKSSNSTSPVTATVSVSGVSGLQTSVQFTNATTGDPATLRVSAASKTIYVSGVGQNDSTSITVTVLDSSGAAIKESGYTTAGVNNLRVTFVARPRGGEVVSGRDANNNIVSSGTSSTVDVRTSNGLAVLNLQSGSISGIVELKFEVLKFASAAFNSAADVAVSATLPQISIQSGPAASIVFTQPRTNAVQVLKGPDGMTNSGNYRLLGSADVKDRYGNSVPDGTIISLNALDSVLLHDKTGSVSAGSLDRVDLDFGGGSFGRVQCNEPTKDREVTGCATNTAPDFSSTITRGGAQRVAQANDLLVFYYGQSSDKRRALSQASAGSATVQAPYSEARARNTPFALNGEFWLGRQQSALSVSCMDASGKISPTNPCTSTNGVVPLAVDYPANAETIFTGCLGYNADGSYSTADRRDSIPQSRQVILVGSAGETNTGVSVATGLSVGDFCFKAVAGITVTPNPTKLSLSPSDGNAGVSLTVVDGGDRVPLPFVPLGCSVTYDRAAGSTFAVTVTVNPNLSGFFATGFDLASGGPGVGSVTVVRTDDGTTADPDDMATVTCSALDGAGVFTVTP